MRETTPCRAQCGNHEDKDCTARAGNAVDARDLRMAGVTPQEPSGVQATSLRPPAGPPPAAPPGAFFGGAGTDARQS